MKNREQLEQEIVLLNLQVNNAIAEIRRLINDNNVLRNLYNTEAGRTKQLKDQEVIKNDIIQKQMDRSNAENNRLLEQIEFLTKKLRGYGYNDKLGD